MRGPKRRRGGRRLGPERRVLSRQLATEMFELVARELALGGDGHRHPVEPRAVLTQDLRLDLLGERRIPVPILELVGDVERAERLDLILRRAVEQAVGPPEHVVLTHVLKELSQHVRRLRRVPHDVPPGRAELRVHVLVGADARPSHRGDQAVDADAPGWAVVGAFGGPRLVRRVVDDEVRVRVLPRRRAYVP